MTEKLENSFHGVFVIRPSIHDCKIIKPKGITREQKIGLLGFGSIELGCAAINMRSILFMVGTGLEMVISGIEESNPAGTMAGIGILTASAIISRLPIRAFKKTYMAFNEIQDSLDTERDYSQNKLTLLAEETSGNENKKTDYD